MDSISVSPVIHDFRGELAAVVGGDRLGYATSLRERVSRPVRVRSIYRPLTLPHSESGLRPAPEGAGFCFASCVLGSRWLGRKQGLSPKWSL
jgi:hypothetical protein